MSDVWLCKQGEGKSTIRGDFAAPPAKIAASAQRHALDGAGIGVGTSPEKGVGLSFDNRLLAS